MNDKLKSPLKTHYRINYQFVTNRQLRSASLVELHANIEDAKQSAEKFLAAQYPDRYKITSITEW